MQDAPGVLEMLPVVWPTRTVSMVDGVRNSNRVWRQ